jgi:hypothetical protein
MAATVTRLGWCRTLTVLLLRSESIGIVAPYKENVPVVAIPNILRKQAIK